MISKWIRFSKGVEAIFSLGICTHSLETVENVSYYKCDVTDPAAIHEIAVDIREKVSLTF